MTFGKPRFAKNEFELLRYAGTSTSRVTGGASKLFKHFVRTNLPDSIVSYSDCRWGSGTLYQNLGMAEQSSTVGYYYTDYKQRFNRMKFQKHKLVKEGANPHQSEWEIMQLRGYDRIWDCGQTKWVWHAAK